MKNDEWWRATDDRAFGRITDAQGNGLEGVEVHANTGSGTLMHGGSTVSDAEGHYTLDFKKEDSAFHRAIHISYPNDADKQSAAQLGVDPGGAIMIHGQRNWLGWLSFITQRFNWTDGCIAVTNSEMDEIWDSVPVNTPIEIRE